MSDIQVDARVVGRSLDEAVVGELRPIPAKRYGLVKGLLGLWAAPGSVGPHLGACRWQTAIAVGVIGLFGSAWLISSAVTAWYYPQAVLTISERLRLGPAVGVLIAMRNLTDREALAVLAAAPLAWAATILLLGVVSMPWADDGEPLGRLFARCVKTACWIASLGIPVALLMIVVQRFGPASWRGHERFYILAGLAGAFWAGFVWHRALMRRAGTDAPRPDLLAPRCIACGYILTGLSVQRPCPECGRNVADSLSHRREPCRWRRAAGLPSRLLAFFPTVWQACFGRRFFEQICVLRNRPAANRFWLYNWIVFTLIVSPVSFQVACLLAPARMPPQPWLSLASFLTLGLQASCVFLVGQAAILLPFFWFTVRDRARSARVGCYLSALLWPWAAGTLATYWFVALVSRRWPNEPFPLLGIAGIGLDQGLLVIAELLLVIWMLRRAAHTYRATRYANA